MPVILPAVALEQKLGDKGLYWLLKEANVASLRSRNHYGLSIAIGGCEISLLDLSMLYSCLATEGQLVRPRFLKTERESAGITLFDPGTAYLITDILTGLRRPDLPSCWEFSSLPKVAWKTGTSYGHRDAWSIGYNPRYTIGVWLGNFNGRGARNLVGAEVATPILFELMNSLCRSQQIPWFSQPKSVEVREVCGLSGQPPGPHCPTLINEYYLPDRSPDKQCECHFAVRIDQATGLRLPPDYGGDRKSITKVFVKYPPKVGTWMDSCGFKIDRLPDLLPGWQDLLQRFSHIGGGGTRRRPEISAAYSAEGTVGFALSHSPKDQKDMLKQFASFCWYYPDNDLCRRGNSYIYLNQYPVRGTRNGVIGNNINDHLCGRLSRLLGKDIGPVATDVVFYTFAVLCSQVYLDKFEGALYTVNRADMRPRIPIVNNAEIFRRLVSLGRRIAELEKRDYVPVNHMGFDVDAIQSQIPAGFRLKWMDQPFDEEHEIFTLTDGVTRIEIPCPLDVQRINIAGYDIIKNVWLKFNSYDFTHCVFKRDDITELLNLINKLVEYIDLVGEIDIEMYDIIENRYPLIQPEDE
jgi:hypothetical protein